MTTINFKLLIYRVARMAGLFRLSRYLTRHHLRILCYHGAWMGSGSHFGNYLFISPEKFSRRISYINRNAYNVVPLDMAVKSIGEGRVEPSSVVITIDDGWYGTYRHMLPLLEAHAMPATIYVTTYYVVNPGPVLNILLRYIFDQCDFDEELLSEIENDALLKGLVSLISSGKASEAADKAWCIIRELDTERERSAEVYRLAKLLKVDIDKAVDGRWFDLMTNEELVRAQERGIDIQLHTHRHILKGLTPESLRKEINDNLHCLEHVFPDAREKAWHFCYPGGLYKSNMIPILKELGIISATTTKEGLNRNSSGLFELSRISDGEDLTDLEFEAKICGFEYLLKKFLRQMKFV